MSELTPNPDVKISITITDADREVLELLRERSGRLDQTGILTHIMNEYYQRLELYQEYLRLNSKEES
jgi:hypothetical protein